MSDRFVYDELVFDGLIVKAHRVGVRMDDGKVVRRDFIHFPGAGVVLPVLDDGSIVLIRNYRFAVSDFLYELPAGVVEEGEDARGCAARELKEETGYSAGRVEKLGGFYSTPGTADEFLQVYLATELTKGEQKLETHERITVEVFPDQTVRRMIIDGTIRDAKTIAGLGIYWARRETN